MKFLQRSCLLLCCLALCLGLFSVPAKAVETPDPYHVYGVVQGQIGTTAINTTIGTLYPLGNTGTAVNKSGSVKFSTQKSYLTYNLYFASTGGTYLLQKGKTYRVNIDDVYIATNMATSGVDETFTDIHDISVYAIYADGTNAILDAELVAQNISFEVTAVQQVKQILVILVQQNFTSSLALNTYSTLYQFGDDSGKGFVLTYEEVDEKVGLLQSIIEWLTDIRDNLVQGFQDMIINLQDGFNDIVTSITELPVKIWEKIETGLKNLFVPDDRTIEQFLYDMDAMLSERMGAVYQAGTFIFDFWEQVQYADETNAIDMPEVTIGLPDNNEFTFGGWTVKIVPEGFDWLATLVKSATGMACVFLFVNGLRKRYDEVMGVEQ